MLCRRPYSSFTLRSSTSSPSACLTPSTSFSSVSVSQLVSPTPYPPPFSSHCFVHPVFLCISRQQYGTSYRNNLPLPFFIIPRHSWFTLLHLPLLISILALCGDIHINPGPSTLFFLPLHLQHTLFSLIETHHPNIIALTETWINKSSNPSKRANAIPSGYTLLSYPRTTKKNHISDKLWAVELCSSSLTQFL